MRSIILFGSNLRLAHYNRIPETLSEEVLAKMHAPAKHDYPIIDAKTLSTFDAFLFGIPTRYGNFPGQWKVRPVRPSPSMNNP